MQRLNQLLHNTKVLALSNTARSTYYIFFGNIFSAFLAFLFIVVIARLLSLENLGYFSALGSLLLLTSDVADVGLGSTLSAFLPTLSTQEEKSNRFLKSAFILQIIVAAFISLIIIILSQFLSVRLLHYPSFTNLVIITAVGVFFTIISNFFLYALTAKQQFLKAGFVSSFGSFIRLILLVILAVFMAINLTNAVWLQTIQVIILSIASLFILNLKFLKSKASKEEIKKIITFAYHIGISRGLTAIASRLDVLMIVAFRGPTEAGIYAIASRVIAIYPLLAGSFSTVIAPKLSSFSKKEEVSKFIFKVILATIGLIGTVIFFIVFASPFMAILFPDKGPLAASTFQLLLISMIFFVGSIPSVSVAIYYLKKPHILSINSTLQLIIVIVGNLIFIPHFGRFGAVYSLLLAYGITLVITSIMTVYYFRKKHD